jgi:ribonuclease P protein component
VKGESIAKAGIQFSQVYSDGRSWTTKEIVLRALPNQLNSSRFGFVVSRRVGKAVVRNHIKRLLREITRQTPVKPGWDIVFIARVPAAVTGFGDLGKSVINLLSRAGLCVAKDEGNRTGLD